MGAFVLKEFNSASYSTIQRCEFSNFYDDDFKLAGGIGFRKPHAGVIPTVFRQNSFDFEDGAEGNIIKGMPRWTFGGLG